MELHACGCAGIGNGSDPVHRVVRKCGRVRASVYRVLDGQAVPTGIVRIGRDFSGRVLDALDHPDRAVLDAGSTVINRRNVVERISDGVECTVRVVRELGNAAGSGAAIR